MADVDASLVQQILDIPKRKRKPDVEHHCQADDIWRCLEIGERLGLVMLQRYDRSEDGPCRFLSDGVDGSTPTASHCAMLVLFGTNSGKEPST